eukprot:Clim_evm75s157 gene=Clim_evmTU75s157
MPGRTGAVKLWKDADLAAVRTSLDGYKTCISALASAKKNGDTLIELDAWLHETLPGIVAKRKPKYIEKSELERLMQWKLSRGKFRPTLMALIRRNDAKTVKSVTTEAFKNIDDAKGCLKTLTQLTGVGPATATALMQVAAPDRYAFFADEVYEALEAAKEVPPLKYNEKCALALMEVIGSRAKALEVTAAELQQAIFAAAHAAGSGASTADSKPKSKTNSRKR